MNLDNNDNYNFNFSEKIKDLLLAFSYAYIIDMSYSHHFNSNMVAPLGLATNKKDHLTFNNGWYLSHGHCGAFANPRYAPRISDTV